MSVKFFIPGPLRQFTGSASEIAIDGSPADVREALEALWKSCLALRDRTLDE